MRRADRLFPIVQRLREGFRNFRLDRIAVARVLEDTFQPMPGRTLRDLFDYYQRLEEAEGPSG